MNSYMKIGGKLALICAAAALALGIVNAVTEPQIKRIKAEKLAAALKTVSGGLEIGEAVSVEGDEMVEAYYPLTEGGELSGYICRIIGEGYGGDIVILAGFNREAEVQSSVMMENQETPGLGKEAERPEYMEKYIGFGGDSDVPVRKDMLSLEESDSISGATITFMGIGKALQAGSDFVLNLEVK